MRKISKAEEYARLLENSQISVSLSTGRKAAAELRRLEAEVERLTREPRLKVKDLEWKEYKSLEGRKLVAVDCFGHDFGRINLNRQSISMIETYKQQKQADYRLRILSTISLDQE